MQSSIHHARHGETPIPKAPDFTHTVTPSALRHMTVHEVANFGQRFTFALDASCTTVYTGHADRGIVGFLRSNKEVSSKLMQQLYQLGSKFCAST